MTKRQQFNCVVDPNTGKRITITITNHKKTKAEVTGDNDIEEDEDEEEEEEEYAPNINTMFADLKNHKEKACANIKEQVRTKHLVPANFCYEMGCWEFTVKYPKRHFALDEVRFLVREAIINLNRESKIEGHKLMLMCRSPEYNENRGPFGAAPFSVKPIGLDLKGFRKQDMLKQVYEDCKEEIMSIQGVTLVGAGNDHMKVGLEDINNEGAMKKVEAILQGMPVAFMQNSVMVAGLGGGEDDEDAE